MNTTEPTTPVQKLKPFVPKPVREIFRRMKRQAEPLLSRGKRRQLFGETESLVPPLHMMFDGPKSYEMFKENGLEYLGYMQKMCRLQPDHKILDIGCGLGRKTIPLLTYLNGSGSYHGMDIVPEGIDWLNRKIAKNHPNFHFQLVGVQNELYNAQGSIKASEYHFPFSDNSFDLVILGSVFTHLLLDGVENYLSEISRVMKPGAHSLITYFLLNEESERLVAEGRGTFRFLHQVGKCRIDDPDSILEAVAQQETDVLDFYQRFGLHLKDSIHYGSWCGRSQYLSYQDIVVAMKGA